MKKKEKKGKKEKSGLWDSKTFSIYKLPKTLQKPFAPKPKPNPTISATSHGRVPAAPGAPSPLRATSTPLHHGGAETTSTDASILPFLSSPLCHHRRSRFNRSWPLCRSPLLRPHKECLQTQRRIIL